MHIFLVGTVSVSSCDVLDELVFSHVPQSKLVVHPIVAASAVEGCYAVPVTWTASLQSDQLLLAWPFVQPQPLHPGLVSPLPATEQ